jgi:5-methyltetrahydrofolate--homocysteine methyltransferase
VIIGGAPVSKEFADEIGADAYAYDAAKAVEMVKEMI